jgi:cytochrome c oxidase subunit 2
MGKQWMWKFAYPGGPSGIEALHVPAGRPVRLLITSRDVIHSFFVPAFRMKQDAIPGRYTEQWFEAIEPGRYPIQCAELCGMGHSFMLGEVIVHPAAEFDDWMTAQREGLGDRRDMSRSPSVPPVADLVEEGRRVATDAGCLKCHSVDGTPHIGPTWLGMYRRPEKMSDGSTLVADEAYLTKSMMDPMAQLVAGYAPIMPTYQGRLAPAEIGALLEYIKSLRPPEGVPAESKGPVYEPARAGQTVP